jgi:acyl-CoA reductase-like NAD-dependent aldehyde dehydrogenase
VAVHAHSPSKQSDLAVACTGVTRSRSRHLISQLTTTDPIGITSSATHYWGTLFGGMKDSGLGREESLEEYESYLELKAVHVRLRR